MKLYYTPGASSLVPHIVLCELGLPYELEKVDLKRHTLEGGGDYYNVNPKGYVPTLQLNDGQRLSEGGAIALFLAEKLPEVGLLPSNGSLERFRVLEWLFFVSSELHKEVGQLFNPKLTPEWKAAVLATIERRLAYVDKALTGQDYLTGSRFSVADAYLFTVLGWMAPLDIDLEPWPALCAFHKRVAARPAVQKAMRAEGLTG
ncbi:glutathione transferase GstA [Azotobacter beijerinckii]|uniref:Glutathione S-transferase n=1 Tax=Azotobacter beijerinckii TaxID=170623 RepID=A0A1I4I0Y8_9GAMM|nr:glutathione transferase GstA [Azotobacter beijerinckii]SFB63382.1 glutathione S-transferase [Azotobacter beijerinckii]SFL47491.1 glutathione S-transferase [Azotobacter beijerinckii]